MVIALKFLLEIARIIFIFIGLGGLVWFAFFTHFYSLSAGAQNYQAIGALGVLLLIYILYKNKFQHFGWVRREPSDKLSSSFTVTLITVAAALIIFPYVAGVVVG